MDTKIVPKSSKTFHCLACDYNTRRSSQYNRHLLTAKHKMIQNDTNMIQKSSKKVPDDKSYSCVCGKIYKYHSGIYRHKKQCTYKEHNDIIVSSMSSNISQDLIMKILDTQAKSFESVIVKQNEEHTKKITELIPKFINNNITTNTTHNKFNINIFLNEKCKDAITMTDFIKSIEISISNLLITKDKGLTDGITNIFVENMNKLPIYKRPLHCTDIKRETLYIKNDKWEKDDYKVKIKEAIKNVSILQTKNIKKYKESKPNCMSNDKEREEYLSIIKNTTDKIDGNDDKIINNLCKNVYINDKTTIE